MNTCDTCKWWDHELWKHVYSGDELKICGHEKVQESYTLQDQSDCADMHNSVDSSIITGPKFGCVHWEPKGLQV